MENQKSKETSFGNEATSWKEERMPEKFTLDVGGVEVVYKVANIHCPERKCYNPDKAFLSDNLAIELFVGSTQTKSLGQDFGAKDISLVLIEQTDDTVNGWQEVSLGKVAKATSFFDAVNILRSAIKKQLGVS